MKKYVFILCILAGNWFNSFSQGTGSISGVIVDKVTKETMIGASIVIQGTTTGANTDLDGKYLIKNLNPGVYDLEIRYISFATLSIKGVKVEAGNTTVVNAALEAATNEIQAVEITAEANKQTNIALMTTLQNTVSMSVGISQETIRRSPDKNVGEVLKRVSGTSIQDNKFVIVRGLSDRYNYGLLNGMPLASTEPDRKAIGFDIFPANVIDNLVISKTATPDLPGEFGGGIIQINTREVPDEKSVSVTAGAGYNTQSTNKEYFHFNKGNKDWIGIDDGTRAMPADFPETEAFQSSTPEEKVELTKQFDNDWQITQKDKMPFNKSLQVTLAEKINLRENKLGVIASVTYNNSNKIVKGERGDYDSDKRLYQYNDKQYFNNILAGGILNFSYHFNKTDKISFKNLFGINTQNQTLMREGKNEVAPLRANSAEYIATNLFSTQLQGEHIMAATGGKISGGFSYSNVFRNTPDLRKMLYYRDENDTTRYFAQIPFGSASTTNAGKFYSRLNDNLYSAKIDIEMPMGNKENANSVKAGFLFTQKDRDFSARVLGYVLGNPLNFSLAYLPQDSLFIEENITKDKFRIDEITNDNDKYSASQTTTALYLMSDNQLTSKFRVIWGIRVESYKQEISFLQLTNKRKEENFNTDPLPSVNLIYSLNEKHKFRIAGSRTVARPEIREISRFAFYDFTESAFLQGNADLITTHVWNADLKYEFYPSDGQMITLTGFYKKFDDPIELVVDPSAGSGSRNYTFSNIKGAYDIGAEIEFRFKLSIIKPLQNWKHADFLSLYSNAAYIKSKVDLSEVVTSYSSERPLQGQSPYLVNVGLDYKNTDIGLTFTFLFNKTGRRIAIVGSDNYADVWEGTRNIIDLSLSKRFLKNGEVKLTLGDVLNDPSVFYQDNDENKRYSKNDDNLIKRFEYGSNYSLSVSYRF